MSWSQIGYSLAAIALLAWFARRLRLNESRIATPAQARQMAEEMLAGFQAHAALVSTDGSAAIVAGNGAMAVLTRRGAKVAVRRMLVPLALEPAIEGVKVATGERAFGPVTLFGVVAEDVRGLEASLTRM